MGIGGSTILSLCFRILLHLWQVLDYTKVFPSTIVLVILSPSCLVFWRRNISSYSKLHLRSTVIDGPVFCNVTVCHWLSVSWHFVGRLGFHLSPSKHSGSAHPTTKHHIPDGINLQPNQWENLKSPNKAIHCYNNDTRDLLAKEIWRTEWNIFPACLSKSHKHMFFYFKGCNLEFICHCIAHNVILTECHSHIHQLIIPLKCPNLLLETFTEWCDSHPFFLQDTENPSLFIYLKTPEHIYTDFVPTPVYFTSADCVSVR